MYIAELKGKFTPSEERKEDILTSNVFSFFKYSDRKIFLFEFLKLLDIEADFEDLINAEFIFWPNYEDGTQPDLIIIVGGYYLLFEAKLFSGFGNYADIERYQLTREYKFGYQEAENFKKEFRLVAITAHYSKYHFKSDLAGEISFDIHWISWHQISLLIYNLLNGGYYIDKENTNFAEDLYSLLVKKNLRNYAGKKAFTQLAYLIRAPEIVFFNSFTAIYRGDFLGFVKIFFDIPQIKIVEKNIFYQNRISTFLTLPNFELSTMPESIFFGKGQK